MCARARCSMRDRERWGMVVRRQRIRRYHQSPLNVHSCCMCAWHVARVQTSVAHLHVHTVCTATHAHRLYIYTCILCVHTHVHCVCAYMRIRMPASYWSNMHPIRGQPPLHPHTESTPQQWVRSLLRVGRSLAPASREIGASSPASARGWGGLRSSHTLLRWGMASRILAKQQ